MVDLGYVKKRRKRRIAAIITCVSSVFVIAFSILAFMGKDLGNFTLEVKSDEVSLTFSKDSTFSETTSYYRVSTLETFEVYSVEALPTDEELDNENASENIGKKVNSDNEVTSLYFYHLTYFIKNVGTTIADYKINLSISGNTKPSNINYGLDDILRVRLYENTGTTHNSTTYAKATNQTKIDSEGNVIDQECIGDSTDDVCDGYGADTDGLATPFVDDTNIFNRTYTSLQPGEYVRYTLMFWLEGFDPECTGDKPKDASLRLDMRYEAYSGTVNNDTN
ncbi:MAG: hypothetical protein WC174_02705 [Bacilli bacterium]